MSELKLLLLLLFVLGCTTPQCPVQPVVHEPCDPLQLDSPWGCVDMEEFCYMNWCKDG
jgi:hypothetical protein